MKIAGAPARFQTKAAHYFEGAISEARAIRREQNPRVTLRHFQRGKQERLEVLLDLKGLAAMSPRKRWRIENDRVEFLAFACEPWQDRHDIVGDESVIGRSEER